MVKAFGVTVPSSQAEATRRQLHASGTLRIDLVPSKGDGQVTFPCTEGTDKYDFEPRQERASSYEQLLPAELRDRAPRAFEAMGDIGIIKVPQECWDNRTVIGAALQEFLGARAVFHDDGVQGTFRVRSLQLLAGAGEPATIVAENGVKLHVDVSKAYFSPRLADERARVAGLVKPGEKMVDMFGGVAPLGVQTAKAGAQVISIDLNPDAAKLAAKNAALNNVQIDVRCGDARDECTGMKADRIVMNLPHGAGAFLDVAARMANPGAVIHYHEILANADLPRRREALAAFGEVIAERHVRGYSATDSHICFDIRTPS